MNKDVRRQLINVLATLVTIAVNALANALPLNGKNTGQISDQFQVYFVPAGYVFAIWGLIYLALLAFMVYQALPAQRENPRLRRIGYLYAGTCLANSVWIFLWHWELFALTVPVMLALLVLLIMIYVRLGIGRTAVSSAAKWCVHIPFSLYLGWITVATVANVSQFLVSVDWGGWGIAPVTWAIIMLLAAALIATLVSLTRGDIAYIAVIVWAFIGIAVKQWGEWAVAAPAALLAAAVAATLLVSVPQIKPKRTTPWVG